MDRIDAVMPAGTVLVVEDEALVALFLTDVLDELGQTIIGPAATAEAAQSAAAETSPEIAIIDVNLGGQASGIELAGELQHRSGGLVGPPDGTIGGAARGSAEALSARQAGMGNTYS